VAGARFERELEEAPMRKLFLLSLLVGAMTLIDTTEVQAQRRARRGGGYYSYRGGYYRGYRGYRPYRGYYRPYRRAYYYRPYYYRSPYYRTYYYGW